MTIVIKNAPLDGTKAQRKRVKEMSKIEILQNQLAKLQNDIRREQAKARDPRSAKLKDTWRKARAFDRLCKKNPGLARSLLSESFAEQ